MNREDRKANFKASMIHVRNVVDQTTDTEDAAGFYRELHRECRRLVPTFRPGHQLFSVIVRAQQLSFWEETAREQNAT